MTQKRKRRNAIWKSAKSGDVKKLEENLKGAMLGQIDFEVDSNTYYGRCLVPCTPLMIAARYRHAEAVAMLAGYGANANGNGAKKYGPLIVAAVYGHASTVRVLIEAGAELNTADEEGWTALMCAAYRGHVTVTQALIDAKAPVDAQERAGYTALHCASLNGHVTIVEALLRAGADTSLLDEEGNTALAVAEKYGRTPAIAQILREHTERVTAGGDDRDPSGGGDQAQPAESDPSTVAPSAEVAAAETVEAPEVELTLVQECDAMVAQYRLLPPLREAMRYRNVMQAKFGTLAADTTDFEAIGRAGTQLQAAEVAVAQQPLSEENFKTLADRHAALVQRVTDRCRELIDEGPFTALAVLGAKLKELQSLHVCLAVEEAHLLTECDTIATQVSQASSLAVAIALRDRLAQELAVLNLKHTDLRSIMRVGQAHKGAIADVAQHPLSEGDYLTLADRHAALVQRVTDKCRELAVTGNYEALEVLTYKLEELTALTMPSYVGAEQQSDSSVEFGPAVGTDPSVHSAGVSASWSDVSVGSESVDVDAID